MKPLSYLAAAALLVSACAPPAALPQAAPAHTSAQRTLSLTPAPVLEGSHTALRRPAAYLTPVLQPLKLEISGEIAVVKQRVSVTVKLPPLPTAQARQNGFRTQALDLSTAAQVAATLSDSYGRTYQPLGADGNGRVTYPPSGNLTLTFNNVLPDQLIFLELQIRDAGADIPQAELAAVISHTGVSDTSGVINFQSTPTAKAMRALLTANATRARAINLADLNALMATVTGYAAGPPATYSTHPSLVNTALLATDLVATDPGSLTAANYRQSGATVSVDISGLVGTDRLDVQVTDAASAVATGLGNGNDQLITAATPGTGLRVLVGGAAGNSTQYSLSVTPSSNLSLSNGASTDVSVVATPVSISIDSLSATAATINSNLTLTGSGFSTTAGNNQVFFGSTPATVNSATATTLVVTVPPNIAGSQPVSVQVGATTSNSSPFAVIPSITNLSAITGSTGDSITLTGTGFSSTLGDNSVAFGGVAATVNSATPTQLVVTVTEAPANPANATVQVGTQTSAASGFTRLPRISALATDEAVAGKAALIRGRNLTLTGTNFQTPGVNFIRFVRPDSVEITVVAASSSATQLVVAVPQGVDVAGDTGVYVVSNTLLSNTLTAIVPTINLDFNGGFQ